MFAYKECLKKVSTMTIRNFIKNNKLLNQLDDKNINVSVSNLDFLFYDVFFTSELKQAGDLSKKYQSSLIVFFTQNQKCFFAENVLLQKEIDIVKNRQIFFDYIVFLSKKIKESSLRKILLEIRDEENLEKIQFYLSKIGFKLNCTTNKKAISKILKDRKCYSYKKNIIIYQNDRFYGICFQIKETLYFFKSLWNESSDISKSFIKQFINEILKINLFSNKKDEDTNISLEEKEKFLEEHIGEGFFIQDTKGQIKFINNTLKNNHKIEDFTSIISNKVNLDKFNDPKETISVKIDTSDLGVKKFFDIRYSPIVENGKITNFCGVMYDITLQKKLEEALKVTNTELSRINRILNKVQNATILGFSKLAEYKDKETGAHLDRIQSYVRALTQEIYQKRIFVDYTTKKNYITEAYIEDLAFSSILHDIGKMGISDSILQKPDKLTYEEFLEMQTHTKIGGDTLKWLNEFVGEKTFLALAQEVAYYHHEKWNGKGYPFGLKGEEIPISARIIGLCDVYDAITSKRSYKEPYSHEKACEIIYDHSKIQFDPIIIPVFSSVEGIFKKIRRKFLD